LVCAPFRDTSKWTAFKTLPSFAGWLIRVSIVGQRNQV
jgi:hypothetical protein